MTKAAAQPAVLLLWGEDPFLLRDAALEAFGDLQPREVDASEWEGGETSDLSTPSLFGERRGLLVGECKSLPDQATKELKRYLAAPAPDALLVLLVRVGPRGKPAAALMKMVEPVGEIREVAIGRKELASWVVARGKRKDIVVTPPAAQALVHALGEEAAELDQAVTQLGDAFPGVKITPDLVAQQFRGLGEQKVWDLCDRAFERNLPASIRSMRSLLTSREEPIMILGGISARVRDLLKVRSLPDGTPPPEVARATGIGPDWRARRYQEQARRFSMPELIGIHEALLVADRELKTGADGEIVLSMLVTRIAG